MNRLPIILASTSEYRAELLSKLDLPFKQASPYCKEQQLENESASDMASRLSLEKAKSLIPDYSNHLIIGSDQTCWLNKQILGKPGNKDQALLQLQAASGNRADFFSAITLLNSQTGQFQQQTCKHSVYFRQLTDNEIDRYLNKEQPFNCAGSFKSEGLGISLFEKIEGNDPNGLIGLPLIILCNMLRNEGYSLP